MMKNKKKNNKGFSLVELIVVIAIMAILAVTITPKLLQYVDKAREANDKGTIDTIFQTTKLTLTDNEYYDNFVAGATVIKTSSTDATPAYYVYSLDSIFDVSISDKWTIKTTGLSAFGTNLTQSLGDFSLKSKSAVASNPRVDTDTDIIIAYNISNKVLSVSLIYGGFTQPTDKAAMTTYLSSSNIYYQVSE